MKKHLLPLLVAIAAGFAMPSFAADYNWVDWTYPTPTSAHATVGAGSIDVSVLTGLGLSAVARPIQFDAPAPLPTQPTAEQAVAVGHGGGEQSDVWTFDITFTLVDTTGLVLGLGNFAHGLPSYPGYKLTAFDTSDAPITSLSGFVQIGGLSYDHTWLDEGAHFNDDVSFDSGTGMFAVTTIGGANDSNSDFLLLSLPSGVGRLRISALETASGFPAGGDTINILATPEPSTLSLAVLGLAAGLLSCRRVSRRGVR